MSADAGPRQAGERVNGMLTENPIEAHRLVESISTPDQGGVVTFLGIVRDHQDGRSVQRLEYSAYLPMAEAECGRIIAETAARWPVKIALRHRIGSLAVGDLAVAVVVASPHRGPAFDACRYVIEQVKRRVPIWKKEYYTDGTVAWVDPTALESAVPQEMA